MQIENEFYLYACEIYEQQAMQVFLLSLQEEHQCDVVLILWFMWLETRQQILTSAQQEAVFDLAKPWQNLILQARGIRKQLKSHALYAQMKQLELSLEQQFMQQLFAFSQALDYASTPQKHMKMYFERCNVLAQADKLAKIKNIADFMELKSE